MTIKSLKKISFIFLLCICFLQPAAPVSASQVELDGVTFQDTFSVTQDEVLSWTSNGSGVSKDLLKTFFNYEHDFFDGLGEALTVVNIGRAIYQDDDKAAFLTVIGWGVDKMIDQFCPSVGTFLLYFKAYKEALNIIHKYLWIPYLEDEVYKAYKASRDGGHDSWEAFYNILYFVEPVLVETKKKILTEKYNLKESEATVRFLQQVNRETEQLLISLLEKRYYDEKLPQLIEEAKKVAEKKRWEDLEKLKDHLNIEVTGIVLDEKTRKPLVNIEVGVEGKRHLVHSRPDGRFQFKVPYRLVDGKPFWIYAKYEDQHKRKQFHWRMKEIPFLKFVLKGKPEEKKEEAKPAPVNIPPQPKEETADTVMSYLDKLKPVWSKAYVTYIVLNRKTCALEEEYEKKYASHSYEERRKKWAQDIDPAREREKYLYEQWENINKKYRSALGRLRGHVRAKARAYLEVNRQWKDVIHTKGKGRNSPEAQSLERKWRRMERTEYKPLQEKVREGNYIQFRELFIQEYHKKHFNENLRTSEINKYTLRE